MSICSVSSIVLDIGEIKLRKELYYLPVEGDVGGGGRPNLTRSGGNKKLKMKSWECKSAKCEIEKSPRGSSVRLGLCYSFCGLCCEVVTKLFPGF